MIWFTIDFSFYYFSFVEVCLLRPYFLVDTYSIYFQFHLSMLGQFLYFKYMIFGMNIHHERKSNFASELILPWVSESTSSKIKFLFATSSVCVTLCKVIKLFYKMWKMLLFLISNDDIKISSLMTIITSRVRFIVTTFCTIFRSQQLKKSADPCSHALLFRF